MTNEIPMPGPCRGCGADEAMAMPYEPIRPYNGITLWFYVQCGACRVSTPMRPSHAAAVNFWNGTGGEGELPRPKRKTPRY